MELKKVILNFTQEELELIKSNSENLIQDLSKATESLESKANLLFSFLILIIGSCLGIFVNIYPNINFSDLLIQLLVLSLIPSFFALRNVYKSLTLTEYKLLGTKPDFHINYDGYKNNDKKKEILKDTIVTYQSIIENNTELHSNKVKFMSNSLDWIMKGIFFSIAYIILYVVVVNFLS